MFKDVCAWFTRENFPAHSALDPHGLQATFDEWLSNAERGVQEAKRHGVILERVVINPDDLAAWCRQWGRKVDSGARSEFAIVVFHKRGMN